MAFFSQDAHLGISPSLPVAIACKVLPFSMLSPGHSVLHNALRPSGTPWFQQNFSHLGLGCLSPLETPCETGLPSVTTAIVLGLHKCVHERERAREPQPLWPLQDSSATPGMEQLLKQIDSRPRWPGKAGWGTGQPWSPLALWRALRKPTCFELRRLPPSPPTPRYISSLHPDSGMCV